VRPKIAAQGAYDVKNTLGVLLAALLTVPALGQTAPPPKHDTNLEPIGWLTGGTWTGSANGPDGTVTHIESRVRWAGTGTAIYFDTQFDGRPQYHGMYAYDPARKKIRFFYTSAQGELSEGEAAEIAGGLEQSFTVTEANRTTAYTSTLKRSGADAYEFNVYQPPSRSPIVTLRYERR
jgi:hypothetical protein